VYFVYDITCGFVSVTSSASFYLGFSGGVFTGSVLGFLVILADRALYIRPENVEKATKTLLQSNNDLFQELGFTAVKPVSHPKLSEFKAFKSRRGAVVVKNGKLSVQRPEVELVFSVTAVNKDTQAIGIVTATRNGFFGENIDFCAVDIKRNKFGTAPQTARVLLKGNQSLFKKLDDVKKQISFNPL
jgi:hypothetical protein